jgi:hypothetical protein
MLTLQSILSAEIVETALAIYHQAPCYYWPFTPVGVLQNAACRHKLWTDSRYSRCSPDTVHNTPRHNIGKLLEHIQQQTQQK